MLVEIVDGALSFVCVVDVLVSEARFLNKNYKKIIKLNFYLFSTHRNTTMALLFWRNPFEFLTFRVFQLIIYFFPVKYAARSNHQSKTNTVKTLWKDATP